MALPVATAFWTVHIRGEEADQINLKALVEELGVKAEVTSASVNINYSDPPKEDFKTTSPKT